MQNIHNVVDTDVHYKINGVTRAITNINETKRMLVQNDHNSERFTFEMPRYFDGHDFSTCNAVQVHYENVDLYEENKSAGAYTVDDLHVSSEDSDIVILTWLISNNATKYVGTLNFSIRFTCVRSNGSIEYEWNTTTFKGITIEPSIYSSNEIINHYPDILAQQDARLAALEQEGVEADKEVDIYVEGATNTVTCELTFEEALAIFINKEEANIHFRLFNASSLELPIENIYAVTQTAYSDGRTYVTFDFGDKGLATIMEGNRWHFATKEKNDGEDGSLSAEIVDEILVVTLPASLSVNVQDDILVVA